MDLGIKHIVISELVVKFLTWSKIVKVDNNHCRERAILNGTQKLLGLLIALADATTRVILGMYGSVTQLGVALASFILLQVFIGGIIVMFLNEIFHKGYGFGSGISLFVAANICNCIIREAFSILIQVSAINFKATKTHSSKLIIYKVASYRVLINFAEW